MNKLDPHTLFSIFEAGDEEVYKEHKVTNVLDNPYVIVGMVTRSVQNYYLMEAMYKRHYKEVFEEQKNNIKLKYYNKMFQYLKRLELNKFETVYSVGDAYDLNASLYAFSDILQFFESIEYYEKCAYVKRLIDILESKTLERSLKKILPTK